MSRRFTLFLVLASAAFIALAQGCRTTSVGFDSVVAPYLASSVPYVASTLEPDPAPAFPEAFVEPLVVRPDAVDCTTFVEYVAASLISGVACPSASDTAYCHALASLRYRNGRRGNYATRKHYFSEWILDATHQGLLAEVTASCSGAVALPASFGFMTSHPQYYPQLQQSASLLAAVRQTEDSLSTYTYSYIPLSAIPQAYASLRHGDVVAFVTDRAGLDVQHVGFVWWPDTTKGEPHLLHASSSLGRVCVSDVSLSVYARSAKHCRGIRIVRLNSIP